MMYAHNTIKLDGMASGIPGLGVVGAYVKLVETVKFGTL